MKYLYTVLRVLAYLFAVLLILSALFVSVGRLLTPVLNEYLPNFETWSSTLLQTPVKIKNVHISWNLYEPELSFDNVALLDKQAHHIVFSVNQIKINLNIFRSLIAWKPIPENIKISGAKLTIHHLNGKFIVEEFKGLTASKNASDNPSDVKEILGIVLAPSRILLKDIHIAYHENNNKITAVVLEHLLLSNSNNSHELLCDAVLEEDDSTRMHAEIQWQGNIEDFSKVSAQIYLYLEGISLPEWLGNRTWQHLQVKDGEGSAKIWAVWNKNTWQSVQTEFQIYDLAINSLLAHRSQKISRLNGHLGWKTDGTDQIIAGEDFLIDLPEHLWPNTHFFVRYTPKEHGYQFKQINISYFDLADVKNIALKSGILSADDQKKLQQISPSGEIQNLNYTLPQGTFLDENNTLSFQFKKIQVQPYDKFPGVSHLKGSFNFANKQADIHFNTHDASLTLPRLFLAPIEFDYLTGHLIFQQKNKNRVLTAENVSVGNADLKANVNMILKGADAKSAFIDLKSNFVVNDAGHISRYLPLKIFKEHLSHWLRTAFMKGQVTSATAVLKGHLVDFPFEHNNGTFTISGQVQGVDLAYAPQWPKLRETAGQLVFSGSAMNVNVVKAKLLDIPLSNIQAVIPYMGSDRDSILKIQGSIQADSSQAMEFIKHSPLADTLGKDMAELDFSGPMKLNLNLTIPLDENNDTKVMGDAWLKNVELDLPDWDLELTHLNGQVHFTENTLKAHNLTGTLFSQNFNLNLDTQAGTDSYIKANLQSKISINSLQEWLHLPLDKYVRGESGVNAELHLRTHDHPVELSLNSNLQGMEVLLPDPLAKPVNEIRDTHFSMKFFPNHKIESMLHYGDVASAALRLEKNKHGLEFKGGEINISGTEAKLPMQEGLVINAKFKTVNVPLLQHYYEWAKKSFPEQQSETNLLRSVNIQADQADILGQSLTQVKIQLSKNTKNWLVKVDSKQMIGETAIALDFSQIRAQFQRLYLNSNSNQTMSIDPKTLPALNIEAKDARYGDKYIGYLSLITTPKANGLSITKLRAGPQGVNLQANGTWETDNQKQHTYLQGSLTTSMLSQFLRQWNINISSLIANAASAKFDLYWEGPPYQPSLDTLSGNLSMQINQGRIVHLSGSTEAKIGLGRMLSIFSLQTIPRRLSLDFSDLFQNGYSFDSMQGNFKFDKGNAYTNDTRLDGPVARVNIAGRIGLQARDYDVQIGLTTYVASSLVPAAVAALSPVTLINPFVAAGALAVGAIVNQTQSGMKSSTYQYSITGTWDNPSWQQTGSAPVTTRTR